jgi:predicted MFS family arabinose efflux permease
LKLGNVRAYPELAFKDIYSEILNFILKELDMNNNKSITPTSNLSAEKEVSKKLIFLLALSCGAIAANIYYAQPLVGLIGPAIGMNHETYSLVVTLTQVGYGLGLIFLVPLGDIIESRRLIFSTLFMTVIALVCAYFASNVMVFLCTSLVIGLSSVVVQMLVPLAAHMAPEKKRGQVVGNVMSGLLMGIFLARPVASIIAYYTNWRGVFAFSAGLVLIISTLLFFALPKRQPSAVSSYGALLHSMLHLLLKTPILQRRAAYHAALFGAFSLFWTAVPLILASNLFGLTQKGIALFAFTAALGVVVAPIAGRLADRGWTFLATGLSIGFVGIAFILVCIWGGSSIAALVIAALLLDMGVACNLVLGQRAIFSLGNEVKSRLNGLYMAMFFSGGAIGSAIAGWAYATDGWKLVGWSGLAFPVIAYLLFLTEPKIFLFSKNCIKAIKDAI